MDDLFEMMKLDCFGDFSLQKLAFTDNDMTGFSNVWAKADIMPDSLTWPRFWVIVCGIKCKKLFRIYLIVEYRFLYRFEIVENGRIFWIFKKVLEKW